MKAPHGYIASPYGVPVAIYRLDGTKDEFHHDIDGFMTLAGIHDLAVRARCKMALSSALEAGLTPLPVLQAHGGAAVTKIPVIRPAAPAYSRIVSLGSPEDEIPVEAWVTVALDHVDWASRAKAFLDILEDNIAVAAEWEIAPDHIGRGLSATMTAALEHLPSHELDCLEAAAFYALSSHPAWRAAGAEWLRPIRQTWFRDWTDARLAYRDFAKLCSKAYGDIPEWIEGAG